MNKGVQCYTVRDYMKDRGQFTETLRRIKRIGYDCVQMGTPPFYSAEETKALLDEIGLYATTVYAGFEKMLAEPSAIAAAVADAHVYGTDLVGIGTLPEEWRESRDGYMRFAEALNKIAAVLMKDNCKIIYHPHALEFYSFGGGAHGMGVLFEETDPSCVYYSLDTHWLASGGVNPVEWIYKAKGRMPLIHFKDYAITGGAQTVEGVNKLFAEVGEGNLNWDAIVKACYDTGVQYAIVEQDFCKGNPFDSLQISYTNMLRFNV